MKPWISTLLLSAGLIAAGSQLSSCSEHDGLVSTGGSTSTGGSGGTGGTGNGGVPATLAVTPVGASTGAPVTQVIGAAGGSLTSGNGKLTLTIPAGALAGNTTIGIETIEGNVPGALAGGFRLTPNGQTFAQPITITYHPFGDDAATTPSQVGLAFQRADGTWQVVPAGTYDAATQTYAFQTTHFTDYAPFQAFQLQSLSVPALLTGKTLTLRVVQVLTDRCAGANPNDVCLRAPGDVVKTNANALSWLVNGQLGGDGAHGTITQGDNPATYTAPATVPGDNTAAISATLKPDGKTALTLVRNLGILAHKYNIGISFEDQETCDRRPDGGFFPFAYDIFTGGKFEITVNDDMTMSVGNIQDNSNEPPDAVGPFTVCTAGGGDIVYRTAATHGLTLNSVSAGLSSEGLINVTLTGQHSGIPAVTITFPNQKPKDFAEDRPAAGQIGGFRMHGFNQETVKVDVDQVNLHIHHHFTTTILQQ